MCHLDHRRRFPIKMIGRAIWILILIARSSKDIQRIEQKPNTQLSSTGRPVTKWKEETLVRTKFDRDTLNQEKHDEVTDPTSTGRPVSGPKSTKRCVFTPRHVENDQTGTGKPLSCKGSRTSPRSRACKKGSKLIFIEQHFMPTCSITSKIHSAKIPKN